MTRTAPTPLEGTRVPVLQGTPPHPQDLVTLDLGILLVSQLTVSTGGSIKGRARPWQESCVGVVVVVILVRQPGTQDPPFTHSPPKKRKELTTRP